MSRQELHNKIDTLPIELLDKVADYLNLISDNKAFSKKLSFDWEGSLEEHKSSFSSIELQHKASEWR